MTHSQIQNRVSDIAKIGHTHIEQLNMIALERILWRDLLAHLALDGDTATKARAKAALASLKYTNKCEVFPKLLRRWEDDGS